MYVKLLNQAGTGDRIYRTGGETVELGSAAWSLHHGPPPHEAELQALLDRIGHHADVYDQTLIDSQPFGYKDGNKDQPFWKLRWARFRQADADAVRLVISTGPIFVLGDNGKTIDRTPN